MSFRFARRRKTASRVRPMCEALDARVVPAVTASFNAATGALVVNIDNNSRTAQNVGIWSNISGNLVINNDTMLTGRTVASSKVHSIVISGSNLGNKIDLSRVDSRGFLGLDGRVTIDGRGGNDNISGSQFADVLHGGDGNDIVSGFSGDDTLFGDGGNDVLFGGQGTDVFRGGSGTDSAADNQVGEFVALDIEHARRR